MDYKDARIEALEKEVERLQGIVDTFTGMGMITCLDPITDNKHIESHSIRFKNRD